MKMKFFVFTIAALVAPTSSNCIAATSRKRKIAKKVGATGQADGDLIPIGDTCTCPEDCEFSVNNCVIPPGLDHGVCLAYNTAYDTTTCQSGQPGSFCRPWESDCVVQNDSDPPHGVCRGPNSKC